MKTDQSASRTTSTRVIEEEIDQSDVFDLTDDGLEEDWVDYQEKANEELSIEERLKKKETTNIRDLL